MMKTIFSSRVPKWCVIILLVVMPFGLSANGIYGDVNVDDEVNIADINALISVILNNENNSLADVNNDGEINIADINTVIDIILKGGIDPLLLDVCKKAAVNHSIISNYYSQCNTIEELKEHTTEFEALDGVEYVFFNETSMFVKLKDFGIVFYSYRSKPDIEVTFPDKQEALKRIIKKKHHADLAIGGIDIDDIDIIIVNQTSKDESRGTNELCDVLKEYFKMAGYNEPKIEPSPDVEFFRNSIFGHDYIFLITHGEYIFDERESWLNPNQYHGTHWLLSSIELSRDKDGNFDKNELLRLRQNYSDSQVSFGTVKERRNGKDTSVTYLDVSEDFIGSSTKQFKHPGKGILFNTACQSMRGPSANTVDSIDYSLSRVFELKGNGAYVGFDHDDRVGHMAGLEFWCNLLSGMSIYQSVEDLPFVFRHDFHSDGHYWGDIKLHCPNQEYKESAIIRPVLSIDDKSNDDEIQIDLHGKSFMAYYYLIDSDFGLIDPKANINYLPFKYGFELSESDHFTNAVILDERRIGDDKCIWDYDNTLMTDFSSSLTYYAFQSDSKIKPNTTYWARAYVYDGHGYNYSEPTSFTTGTLAGDQPSTETFIANGVPFTMVSVEGGTFTMGGTAEQGSDVYGTELPAHKVTLSSFSIGQTEVTQALWRAVMGSNPSGFTGDLNRPVEQVSWSDCQTFISKLNDLNLTDHKFRLPTDAEWEYAARGGKQSMGFKYSGSNSIDEVAWYDYNSGGSPHTVGTKTANELGIYDMSGNVWEWCQDWYENFSGDEQVNPTGPTNGSSRCMRSGSWDLGSWFCRVSHRNYDSPDRKSNHLGFRLAYGDMSALPISLSENELVLNVDEQHSVIIFNGSGNYSVRGDDGIVAVHFNGNELILTAKSAGATTLIVTDKTSKTHANIEILVYSSQTYDVYGVSFSMVNVEGGTFIMGATPEQGTEARNNEKPAHQVTLSSFAIGQTEVTQALWQAVMGSNPSSYQDSELRCPVENISIIDCLTFINKLNRITGKHFRLPTEAEWEYAARGGNMSKGYKYAGSNNIEEVAWYDLNSYSVNLAHRQVGRKKCNELGLYDMSGNVVEMCQTFYYPYSSEPETNPTGPSSGNKYMIRGGGWTSWATNCRVSYRLDYYVEDSSSNLGFRLAMDVE